jgi:hypothetical protein
VPDRVQQVRLARARVAVDERGVVRLGGRASATATTRPCTDLLFEPMTNVSKVYLEAEPSAAEVT